MADSVAAGLVMAALTRATATRFTEARAFTPNPECIPAASEVLVTAETLEGFPRAGGPALEVAGSMEVGPMAVADGTRRLQVFG